MLSMTNIKRMHSSLQSQFFVLDNKCIFIFVSMLSACRETPDRVLLLAAWKPSLLVAPVYLDDDLHRGPNIICTGVDIPNSTNKASRLYKRSDRHRNQKFHTPSITVTIIDYQTSSGLPRTSSSPHSSPTKSSYPCSKTPSPASQVCSAAKSIVPDVTITRSGPFSLFAQKRFDPQFPQNDRSTVDPLLVAVSLYVRSVSWPWVMVRFCIPLVVELSCVDMYQDTYLPAIYAIGHTQRPGWFPTVLAVAEYFQSWVSGDMVLDCSAKTGPIDGLCLFSCFAHDCFLFLVSRFLYIV